MFRREIICSKNVIYSHNPHLGGTPTKRASAYSGSRAAGCRGAGGGRDAVSEMFPLRAAVTS